MSKLYDTSFPSLQEAKFAAIMFRIKNQVKELGGVFTESTGMQGSGKTAFMLSMCSDNMIKHPDQKNFWRNTYDSPFQFTKLKPGSWEILVEKGADVTFYERLPGLPSVDLEAYTKNFSGFEDLYNKATPGKCSAVFFRDESFWYGFINYLRSVGEWCHVFLDEYGELFPANPSGPLYRMIMDASLDLGEVRKCFTNVHATTQVTSDVDYRIRRKIMIYVYFPGALASNKGRVNQKAIDGLRMNHKKGNQIWMELKQSIFGKGKLLEIYEPRDYMDWAARRPEDAIRVSDYLRKDIQLKEKKKMEKPKTGRHLRKQVAPA